MNIDIESLKELSPPVLLMLALNVVGWVAKQSALPNRFIPPLLILLGAIAYPMVYDYGDMVLNVRHQLAIAVIQGICIGGAAVGAHQAMRAFARGNDDSTLPPKA